MLRSKSISELNGWKTPFDPISADTAESCKTSHHFGSSRGWQVSLSISSFPTDHNAGHGLYISLRIIGNDCSASEIVGPRAIDATVPVRSGSHPFRPSSHLHHQDRQRVLHHPCRQRGLHRLQKLRRIRPLILTRSHLHRLQESRRDLLRQRGPRFASVFQGGPAPSPDDSQYRPDPTTRPRSCLPDTAGPFV